jgi:hypothetical protein
LLTTAEDYVDIDFGNDCVGDIELDEDFAHNLM